MKYFLFMLCAGCAVAEADPLRIAVASSVQEPMRALVAAFNTVHPECDAEMVVGSSGKLTAQIVHGAPYDLFFSADMTYPEYLQAQGRAASPVKTYAEGTLVLYVPDRTAFRTAMLTNAAIRRIAVANPRVAPYGRAAIEVLKSTGLHDAVHDKLVYAESVAQTMHFLESGAADAAFVAKSLVVKNMRSEPATGIVMLPGSHAPLRHGYVAIADPDEHACVASFMAFIEEGRSVEIFSEYGFRMPGADGDTLP